MYYAFNNVTCAFTIVPTPVQVTTTCSTVKSNFRCKKQTRLVFLYVAGGDDWKLVAEKLGLTPLEIRFLDNRVLNPADAALSYIAHQRLLTVGNLYDVLASCNLPLIADDL